MAEESFETFVQRERDRLQAQREALVAQQQELEKEIALVDREMSAVNAYEAAKSGRAPARQTAARRTGTRRTSGARSGSERDELLKLIQESEGLTRGEILGKMGLKGNKSGARYVGIERPNRPYEGQASFAKRSEIRRAAWGLWHHEAFHRAATCAS
jgi:hypothetical protein